MAQGQQRKSQTGSSGPPLLVEVVQGFCSVLQIDAMGKVSRSQIGEIAAAKMEGKSAEISLKSSGARSKSGVILWGLREEWYFSLLSAIDPELFRVRGRRS